MIPLFWACDLYDIRSISNFLSAVVEMSCCRNVNFTVLYCVQSFHLLHTTVKLCVEQLHVMYNVNSGSQTALLSKPWEGLSLIAI